MNPRRVCILGASGCGTTTLARELCAATGWHHADSDSYFWLPSDPAFEKPRPPEERISLLSETLKIHTGLVLSGSFCGWGDFIIPHLDWVVFLTAPTEIRLKRIHEREAARLGKDVISPGGAGYEKYKAFVEWSSAYDSGGVSRTRNLHENWIRELKCPVLRLESIKPTSELLDAVMSAMGNR